MVLKSSIEEIKKSCQYQIPHLDFKGVTMRFEAFFLIKN